VHRRAPLKPRAGLDGPPPHRFPEIILIRRDYWQCRFSDLGVLLPRIKNFVFWAA
jgi:hypothetical protein